MRSSSGRQNGEREKFQVGVRGKKVNIFLLLMVISHRTGFSDRVKDYRRCRK